MDREVASLLRRQVRTRFQHPLIRLVECRVAPRLSGSERALRVDGLAAPFRDGRKLTSRQDASPPFDDHEPFDVLGIGSGVPQGDVPTQGVGNDP